MADLDSFLSHHGVLGMHWGQSKSGRKASPAHEEHTSSRAALKKPVHELSTKQIRDTNNRLDAEKRLSELKGQRSSMAKGQKFTKSILAAGATAGALYALANSPHGKAAIKSGSTFVDSFLAGNGKHAIGYVAPIAKAAAKHL